MFGAMKQKVIEKAASVVIGVLKRDIISLLGEDAREQDVEVISSYFDDGIALQNVKAALAKADII